MRPRRFPGALADILTVVVAASAFGVTLGTVETATQALSALPPGERHAMEWVSTATPVSSRFLVISGKDWVLDRSSEWFPALARRVSVVTPQGSEWLPGGEFFRRVRSHGLAQECAAQDPGCLGGWSDKTGDSFTHLYIVMGDAPDCCAPLRSSLRRDGHYEVLYNGPGATIFARSPSEP